MLSFCVAVTVAASMLPVVGCSSGDVPVGRSGQELGEENTPCDLDLKTCPDGSQVGRVAPKCEFAECPTLTGFCTKEAKTCPDGTLVGRIPPKCEFEACKP